MSKKRAFVRYTKSGEIVPGSLIITTNGGYPDKSSIWKEIQTNECCDGGVTNLFIQELQLPNTSLTALQLVILCVNYPSSGQQVRFLDVYIPYIGPAPVTPEELITLLNDQLSFLGVFTLLTPTTANLAINSSYLASGVCANPQVEVGYFYS